MKLFNRPARQRRINFDKEIALYLEDINVSFDGFRVIDNLSLYIRARELRCIIGPNGAGKTTLMDVITGKTRPDSGEAWFGQEFDLLRHSEDEIAIAGIGRKFQTPTVFENLSVFVNLELAMAANKGVFNTLFARLTKQDTELICATLDTINLYDRKDEMASSLSHGQKQWLEIGMLLVQGSILLLVDEPAAGMTHQEIDKTAQLLLELKQKYTVIVVEHDMDFIRSLDSFTTVLHQGSVLAEGSMHDIQQNEAVKEVYLG